MKTVGDLALLQALCKNDERLSPAEDEAFWDMKARVESGKIEKLSHAQREWASDVYRRLELDAEETLNLYSSGSVPTGAHVAVPEVLRNLPKKPPRRR